MADDELHYPPGAEPEKAEPEKEPEPKVEPKKDKPEPEKEPEAEKPKAEPEKKDETPVDPPPIKKRSVYDDLKDRKKELKDTRSELEIAQARIAELEALKDIEKDAETPEEKKQAAKDIKEYAAKHKLDADSLEELTNIVLSKVPKAESQMTPEEVDAWRKSQATAKQTEEDNAIRALAPSVKTELAITDDKELKAVMDEVVRLAHTTEFHDKEVEYIVWKNKTALAKLVSPKKASFENGGQGGEGAAEVEPDYGSGKVTPAQVQSALTRPKSSYEVRKRK
jgi:hypothetical protein